MAVCSFTYVHQSREWLQVMYRALYPLRDHADALAVSLRVSAGVKCRMTLRTPTRCGCRVSFVSIDGRTLICGFSTNCRTTERMYSKLSACSLEVAAPLGSFAGVEASETTLSVSRPTVDPLGVPAVPCAECWLKSARVSGAKSRRRTADAGVARLLGHEHAGLDLAQLLAQRLRGQ